MGKPQDIEAIVDDADAEAAEQSTAEAVALTEALQGEEPASSEDDADEAGVDPDDLDGGDPAPAVVDTEPGVEDHAAVEMVEPESEAIEPPTQGDDGKWRMGKYVADSPEELVLEIERARQHAARLVGKRVQDLTPEELAEISGEAAPAVEEPVNPFDARYEQEDDGGESDAEWFGSMIGTAAQQLAAQQGQAQGTPQEQQFSPYAQQALANAQRVIEDPMADAQQFRSVLSDVIQHAPQVAFGPQGAAERVLQEWANVDPYGALSARQDLQAAALAAQNQAMLQQRFEQEQAEQAAIYEQQTAQQQEWGEVRGAFESTFTDWTDRAQGMAEFMQQNPHLLEAAKMIPDPQQRKAAVFNALRTAYQVAQPSVVDGTATGAAGNMSVESADPAAAHRAALSQDKELGGVDTGGGASMSSMPSGVDPDDVDASDLEDIMGVRNLSS